MSKEKHKDLETVVFQIRIKRATDLDASLSREIVYIELSGSTQKADSTKTKKKKKKLWKTPLVEVSPKRIAGFGKLPLYPTFLLSRRIPPPGANLKPDPVELTLKLKHSQDSAKKKTLASWKFNIMRFYKVTEPINTVLFRTDDGPRITLNVMDITELQRQGDDSQQISDNKDNINQQQAEEALTRAIANNDDLAVIDITANTTNTNTSVTSTTTTLSSSSSSLPIASNESNHGDNEKSPKPGKKVMPGIGSDSNGNLASSGKKLRSSSVKKLKRRLSKATEFKKKKEKSDAKGEDSGERISEVEISESGQSEKENESSNPSQISEISDVEISEAKYAKEDASEGVSPGFNLSKFNLSPKKIVPTLSSNLFSVDSVVKDDKKFDTLYKVIIIGNSGVGKSSVMGRWTRDEFALNIPSTIHVELSAKTFCCNDKIVKVQFWDTAGQEKFNSVTSQYYRGAHGAVLVYDITQKNTFEEIPRWLNDLRDANPEAEILLVGNKSDLDQFREVPADEALNYSKSESISFLETSAVSGENCTMAMQLILQDIHKSSGTKVSLESKSNQGKVPTASVKLTYDAPKKDEESEKGKIEDKKCEC